MRSVLLSLTALALLLPLTGQAAPKPTKTKPQTSKKLPGASKPSFNPDPPQLPKHPRVPSVDGATVYVPQVPIKGDLTCRRGDADCNPCTPNVREQFAKMRRGDSKWKRKPWRFEWGTRYAPSSIRPYEAFDSDTLEADLFGLSHAHPQGFVRTNEGPAWYAGTHSQKDDRPGTVFIIEQDDSGKKRLVALHQTETTHPSGLHVLGRHLLFGERVPGQANRLKVIDLQRRTALQTIAHIMPRAVGESESLKMFGGGLAAAKLSDGSYLLLSTVPGDRKTERKGGGRMHRYNQFFNLKGNLSDRAALTIRFLSEQRFSPTAAVPQKYEFSENVSLVTECTTGDIYAMHSSGDGEGPAALEGWGYWRLSKLVREDGDLQLQPLDVFDIWQSATKCHMRSAASVGVGPNGKLEFLCHQYRKDPDPSLVNPLGGNISGNDHWNFSAGVPKD